MSNFSSVLVTGGCGFIGANFIRYLFDETDFRGKIINIDCLTYSGNPENLSDIVTKYSDRYVFEKLDIINYQEVCRVVETNKVDLIVHFAAESHVDRSIHGPGEFVQTNIVGTFSLLEVVRKLHAEGKKIRFHHVSTDEVFGSLGETGKFLETTPYDPRSPYSASKASSDMLVRAYSHTYGIDITISNCSNNYGPYQFPEKLLPLMICNMLSGKNLPVYGDGKNIRDWLYVRDHCEAVWMIANKGKSGQTYNVGGENEWTNIDLLNSLCEISAELLKKPRDTFKKLIVYVPDRPGHDRRYAIDCEKIKKELGWKQSVTFAEGLRKTVEWYHNNLTWIEHVKSGEYKSWLEKNYGERK
ncbi:MAG: dTDP-glucose 4,6-dehydratase [Candidatus Riflebacteria bacterium]|nr:dTDP-glucose 4,6-dehydratase [Candidatus Riflebacteria bacterium]